MNAEKPPSPDGMPACLKPGSTQWEALSEEAFRYFCPSPENLPSAEDSARRMRERIASNRQYLGETLQTSLQLPNLSFFAGSGTSLGEVKGPSMWSLWLKAMTKNPSVESGEEMYERLSDAAAATCEKVRYRSFEQPNIEYFLSQCDAYLLFNGDAQVEAFVNQVKGVILQACSGFLESSESDISAYKLLLQKLARRRVRDPRLKIFTTNYDRCFETAAAELGMMVVDGFSYTHKRRFDPRYFDYDVVRRDGEKHEFVEGVCQLHKLHGSVSWAREGNEIHEAAKPSPESACLIYPAKGKYQQAFLQPHLELLSRFLDSLRRPNSCLLMAGFGFNDDHLSEPIYSAIRSNPGLKLIVADPCAARHIGNRGRNGSSDYWSKLADLGRQGCDILFINASFSDFVQAIPHLKALSPAEELAQAIKRVGG